MEEFEGIWDIQEMEGWEHRDLHEMGIPHFEINKYGSGRFKFSYTMGIFDARLKTRGGVRLAFKWQGSKMAVSVKFD